MTHKICHTQLTQISGSVFIATGWYFMVLGHYWAVSRNNITGGQETRQAGKEDPRHSGESGSSSAHLLLEDGDPF